MRLVADKVDRPRLAVVLSGGGARAAYQVGVLAAIAERRPQLQIDVLSGVSAGAINTITLGAHPGSFLQKVRALKNEWSGLHAEQVYRVRVGGLVGAATRWVGQRLTGRQRAPTVVRGVMDLEPLREFLSRRVNLKGLEANIGSKRIAAVTLSSTSYTTGETITFVQGGEGIAMWQRAQRRAVRGVLTIDHVIASASIPILFPAIRIEGAYYGDGSVRHGAPLAPAIHLGASKILAIGMRSQIQEPKPTGTQYYPSAAQVMGMLFHSIFLDTLDADQERLDRINLLLAQMPEGTRGSAGLRSVGLYVVRPSVDLGALARPHFHRLPPAMRTIVNSIGGKRDGSADFLSYLMFDPAYTVPLIELGYDDATEQLEPLCAFLDS